jgi:hypothetical protein
MPWPWLVQSEKIFGSARIRRQLSSADIFHEQTEVTFPVYFPTTGRTIRTVKQRAIQVLAQAQVLLVSVQGATFVVVSSNASKCGVLR